MDNICPVTGKPCANPKIFHIDEITDTETKHVVLCHVCAKPYFEDNVGEIKVNPSDQLKAMMEFMAFIHPDKKQTIEDRLKTAKGKLEKAVEAENFEAAMIIRQKIARMEEVAEQKNRLLLELNAAVKERNYEKAKEVKKAIDDLLREFNANGPNTLE